MRIKTVKFYDGETTIEVSKKAYDGISKKAVITNLRFENSSLHIEYVGKRDKAKGYMCLYDITPILKNDRRKYK